MPTYRTSSGTKARVLLLIAAVAAIAVGLIRCAVVSDSGVSALDADEVRDYLTSLGWETSAELGETDSVTIPAEFGEVYEMYNELQKSCGYDLSDYRAEECTRYTFPVLNHEAGDGVFANVLVFDGKIIGGDLCSYAQGGFMTGLTAAEDN